MSYAFKHFRIQKQNILLSEEQKALILLYQPLIGSNALGLYNTLYFLNDSFLELDIREYTHQFLFDLLNIDEKDFEKIKEKLEIVNLLDTFQNDNKNRIYILHPPLIKDNFFQDPILNQFLLSEVGENIYTYLRKLFILPIRQINLTNYQKISKTFPEIHRFHKTNFKNLIHKTLINSQNLIFRKYFDYEMFISGLPERFKKPFLLEWKSIDFITKIAFIYEIPPQEMSKIYQESFRNNYEENIDLNFLTTIIKRKFIKEEKMQIVNTQELNDKENEMILYLKNTHPHRIINNFGKNKYFCAGLYDIVLRLHNQNNVENGVINALLMYVCKLKEHHNIAVPSYNYFQTILNSWLQKGIISTETAYDFLMENNKQYSYKSNKKNNPKWLNDIKKELGLDD
ncbi:MAG: DnaD domain protein [Vigna little leaf phytoplasma]|nr:DnaD domain protein [Vigna little leaf phytoplasma]